MLSLICPWHCSHRGTETGAACLSCPLKLQTYLRWFVACASVSPALKMRTSADSSQPERASLESCCSASSAHGTARTEAHRLGLLACLAPSNFKRIFGCPCRGLRSPALKMRTSADSSQPERASLENCCQLHLPMAVHAQRHRDWGCLLVLPPQNSNVNWDSVDGASGSPALKMRKSAYSLQT